MRPDARPGFDRLIGSILILLTLAPAAAPAQEAPRGVPRFPIDDGPLALHGPARSGAYLADLGRRAALLGDETGAFEVWTRPLGLVHDLRLAFRLSGSEAAVPGDRIARSVTVRPEGATITYSHGAFTVKQHVFVPLDEPGALMLLDVRTVRPLEILVRAHADFELAWPDGSGGATAAWLDEERRFLLSRDGLRRYHGMIGSPFAVPGAAQPAHDAPAGPLQFVLRVDAGRTAEEFIPIAIAGGAAPRDSIAAVYDRLLTDARRHYGEKLEHYRDVRRDQLAIATPDARLDLAIEWAKVNLDQQLVCDPDPGCGLVAGFGRDVAIGSFGMDALGRFEPVRRGLAFLAGHQRDDGRLPHGISHAAARLPWFSGHPFTWSHGGTTPLWILACFEYWKAAGDDAFLGEFWPNLVRAYRWAAATDGDGDGLMENPLAGAGAVGGGGLGEDVHTDIQLAGVWVAALEGMREMARAVGEDSLAREADALFERASRSLEDRFWLESAGVYAFALPRAAGPVAEGSVKAAGGGRPNDALTVWPVAAMAFRLLDQGRSGRMLREIGSSAITADWGTRPLARDHPLYDPLRDGLGAVGPFMTGFVALAHYRHHRAWAGFDLVRDIARTTFDFARGRQPDLLSGAFYQILDPTVPQRFPAASMLVDPLVRGLLGLEADAPNRALAIEPHLPAHWDSLTVENVRVGAERLTVSIRREGEIYALGVRRRSAARTKARSGTALALRVAPALPLGARVVRVTVNGRDAAVQVDESAHDVHPLVELALAEEALIEIEFRGGVEIVPPAERLRLGQASEGLRVLDFRREGRDYVLLLDGLAGRTYPLELRADGRIGRVRGASLDGSDAGRPVLLVPFPAGADGYVRHEVRFRGP